MRVKITYYLALIIHAFPVHSLSQVSDNFADGNFTYAPAWSGNDTDFIVNGNQQLMLNSSGTSASYLSLSNNQPLANCEWNFWINLAFSPSANNYARVYLVSNQKNLSGSLNGYYLQFGENGSLDRVELFSQSGTTSSSVCRGTTSIANAFAIRVKVTRDNAGLWKLYLDAIGGTNYALEASGTDNSFTGTSYFGIFCNYTTTNATKFFFDDFYIYAPPDITPPSTDSIQVLSQNKIDAYFSEPLSVSSAQTIANYSVYNNIGYAATALLDAADASLVHLSFANNFVSGQSYVFTVTGVQDLAGNTALDDTTNFFFNIPRTGDVVINEIMADINPAPNSVPAYEYIELYNRTNYFARLSGWKISDAASSATIPDILIPPDSFYVLASSSAASAFGSGVQVAGVSSFPTLNDPGDDLILRDASGNIISVIFYRDDWYNDPIKDKGGWSIEQIDPNGPCSGKANWRACADNSGGTPGRRNSVYAFNPDVAAPKISHTAIIAPNTIQLFFDEPMDSATLLNLSAYSIDNGMGAPLAADPVEPDYMSVTLTLSSSMVSGTMYSLTVNGVKDCAGNVIAWNSITRFALAETVVPNDLLINEVMFDPKDNGVEWVEIYNRSAKVLDLKDIYLCSQDKNGNLIDISQVSPYSFLILPKGFMVLSQNGSTVKSQYSTANTEGFIDMSAMPSLNNDSDYVLLINASQAVIDKLQYHSDWHLPLLNDTKGISLERINYESPTQDENNWHSASENAGGATPACKNSQYTEEGSGSEVTLTPEVFSPDNDGYNDILTINYAFDSPAMVGNVNIFDSRGQLVKNLVRNELLATSGTFFWDGFTNDKLKAPIGIYIVYFEAFSDKGKVKKYKKGCVVAGKL